MAIVFKPGDEIISPAISKRYRIECLLNEGGFCNAYRAIDTASELPVFLKQYTNPTPALGWARGFYAHQDELKQRLDRKNSPLIEQSYEYFFHDDTYYQVKEFVTGTSLAELLEPEYAERITDQQWFLNAAVLMKGIADLHDTGIVHEDLKPENVYMEKVPEGIGYRATIIDLDFSFLDGRTPPFADPHDGTAPGYVGTPTYQSPEHVRGKRPGTHSDIFTGGIILYQMLVGIHPIMECLATGDGCFDADELNQLYAKSITTGKYQRPETYNDDLEKYPRLCDTMAAMLNPDPAARPSAKEVHQVLVQVNSGGADIPVRVRLTEPGGRYREYHQDTVVTHGNARFFGESYKFIDHRQFELLKDGKNNQWLIRGLQPVTNNTRLNGEKITGETRSLKDGDIITVGGGRGLRLTVKLVYT
ncbi:MAG: hypothetical protein DRH04_00685 [Deltaproteobacteria bacterium]|nr:MAG: hypothetical protein DRH04_00685 [Deltaproteobacteria bacterium]